MLTKTQIIAIQNDIQAALKAVSEKHNLSMSGTKIQYTSTDFKLACTFADKSETGGEDINPDLLRNLKRNGFMYGMTVEMLNKEIDTPQGRGKFQGLRGAKAVVKMIGGERKGYLFPAEWVGKQLNK